MSGVPDPSPPRTGPPTEAAPPSVPPEGTNVATTGQAPPGRPHDVGSATATLASAPTSSPGAGRTRAPTFAQTGPTPARTPRVRAAAAATASR